MPKLIVVRTKPNHCSNKHPYSAAEERNINIRYDCIWASPTISVEKLALFCNPASGGTLQALQLHCLVRFLFKKSSCKSEGVPASWGLGRAYLKTALSLSHAHGHVIPRNKICKKKNTKKSTGCLSSRRLDLSHLVLWNRQLELPPTELWRRKMGCFTATKASFLSHVRVDRLDSFLAQRKVRSRRQTQIKCLILKLVTLFLSACRPMSMGLGEEEGGAFSNTHRAWKVSSLQIAAAAQAAISHLQRQARKRKNVTEERLHGKHAY
jgi:hypothetical protein